jgi:hypothetical protein
MMRVLAEVRKPGRVSGPAGSMQPAGRFEAAPRRVGLPGDRGLPTGPVTEGRPPPRPAEAGTQPGDAPFRPGHQFSRIAVSAAAPSPFSSATRIRPSADPHEMEAERVADQVSRIPAPRLQRTCACGGVCPRCRAGGAGAGSHTVPPMVRDGIQSAAEPLEAGAREVMESRLGHDFGQVRVHAGERAARSARALDAQAYTLGRDIVFGAGRYAPHSAEGRHLLAHELTHVVQQRGTPALQRKAADGDSPPTGPVEDDGGCWQPGQALDPGSVHGACLAADGKPPCPPPPGETARAVDASRSSPAPDDPISVAENAGVNQVVAGFQDWTDYRHDLIVVPGFTPPPATTAWRMHPQEKTRLERAQKDLQDGQAPFIFVSGGAVYPAGTPCYEGVEMKHELIDMGVPADRIIVDAAAQHSTTNIRNAGRYMLAQKRALTSALITTSGSQDFYFSHPGLSTFHKRSREELGYEVGGLRNARGRGHSVYTPSERVREPGLDPQDR